MLGVVLHALDVVRLRHDLEVERHEHHGDGALAEDDARDLGRGAEDLARVSELALERVDVAVEERLVLHLFVGEAHERADGVVVAEHLRVRVLHGDGDDVLLDEAEEIQIRVRGDVIELERFARRQER